jgi:hypothetical protein
MSKKNIKLLAWLCVGLISFSACSDEFLETEPGDSISEGIATSNATTINSVLEGTYRLNAHYYYEGLYGQGFGDVRGDDAFVINSSQNYGWFKWPYLFDMTTSNSWAERYWNTAYSVIDNANIVIRDVETAEGDAGLLAQYKSEALCLRAYAYLNLCHWYGNAYSKDQGASAGVLLRLTPFSAADDPSLARSSVAEVYTQILADLNAAIGTEEFGDVREGRFSQAAAYALLARTYMDKEDYTNAASFAEKAAEGHSLMDEATYLSGFNDYNSEVIWGFDYTPDDNGIYASIPSFWYYFEADEDGNPVNVQQGYSSLRLTRELYSLFEDQDIRKTLFPILDQVNYPLDGGDPYHGGYVTNKFRSRSSMGDARLIKIRAGEMLLIAAEAYARNGQEDKALANLHQVQGRAKATLSASSGEALITDILNERRKELFGEGFRALDIKRLGLEMDRNQSTGHWGTNKVFSAYDDKYLFPIPQDEIDSNDALSEADQNAAYQ